MGLVKIYLSANQYQQILDKPKTMAEVLAQLVFDPETRQNILIQLQNYHSDEDGAPIVHGFNMAVIDFNPPTYSGQIRFIYRVDYTFACADHRSTTQNTETSNFVFEPGAQTIALYIHDKISRDTVDEF